jgi:hypothetical protein
MWRFLRMAFPSRFQSHAGKIDAEIENAANSLKNCLPRPV